MKPGVKQCPKHGNPVARGRLCPACVKEEIQRYEARHAKDRELTSVPDFSSQFIDSMGAQNRDILTLWPIGG